MIFRGDVFHISITSHTDICDSILPISSLIYNEMKHPTNVSQTADKFLHTNNNDFRFFILILYNCDSLPAMNDHCNPI